MEKIDFKKVSKNKVKVSINNETHHRKIIKRDNGDYFRFSGEKHYLEPQIPESVNRKNTPSFNINKRFKMLGDFTDMVLNGVVNSLLVTGQGGLGKSHSVMEQIQKMDLVEDEDYVVIKGYSTPKALYRTIYENSDKIIVFDDCDSVLKDPTALNLLKGALDTYDKRVISWKSSGFVPDDLPSSVEFKGQVIFISNLSPNKIDGAVKSRTISVDVSMNTKEKIQRIESVMGEILPEYTMNSKKEVLEFLKNNLEHCEALNFRTFQNITKVRNEKQEDWKSMALYLLLNT